MKLSEQATVLAAPEAESNGALDEIVRKKPGTQRSVEHSRCNVEKQSNTRHAGAS